MFDDKGFLFPIDRGRFFVTGAPHSLRGKLWSQVLGCGSTGDEGSGGAGGHAVDGGTSAKEAEYYQSLQVHSCKDKERFVRKLLQI